MPAPEPHVPPLTSLVAGDDADLRAYVAGVLAEMGFERIAEAADGREALRLIRAQCPSLVVADVSMPYVDGHALCRALRADPSTASVLLLLLSGETRGPPRCADGFLLKPFNAADLRTSTLRLLP
ncbi:MAG: response regulator [Bacteroidota bacterium]